MAVKPYYQDDLVTLFHGDCLEVAEWLGADVLVTDPPYGVDVSQYGMDNNPKKRKEQAAKSVIQNDKDTKVRDHALMLWGSKPAIVFGSWRKPRPENVRQRLIWYKSKASPGISSAPWYPADEEIYIIGKGFTGKPEQNVYQTNEARMGRAGPAWVIGHPTPKPIGLMERLIAKCPHGVIADPFAGSGATLIAARNLGRSSIGVEYEEKYCELIATRLSQQAFDLEGLLA
jgi:site-specific DNA-methyltransferase (adenine-specific)